MKKRLLSATLVLVFIPILASDLIPPDDTVPGWTRKDETKEFPGSSLYRHINGGAELYHRHGFEHLFVQDFRKGEIEVRLEIYCMKTAEGALAAFNELNSGIETGDRFGSVCVLDEYQIMFVRGACLVSVTRYEKSEDSKPVLDILAKNVDERIGN